MSLDHTYTHAFFHATRTNWIARHVAVVASTHIIWLMLGIVFGVYSWDALNNAFLADVDILFFLALLLPAWIISLGISKLVNRERPYLETHQKPLIDPFVHTASFPSAHATIAFSIAALTMDTVNLFPYMLGGALLVALGRVATGVHFFSDVIVGALIGFFVTQAAQIAFLLLLASK